MNGQVQLPPLTTWLLAAMPVLGLLSLYKPEFGALTGLVLIGGGGLAFYQIGRWVWASMRVPR